MRKIPTKEELEFFLLKEIDNKKTEKKILFIYPPSQNDKIKLDIGHIYLNLNVLNNSYKHINYKFTIFHLEKNINFSNTFQEEINKAIENANIVISIIYNEISETYLKEEIKLISTLQKRKNIKFIVYYKSFFGSSHDEYFKEKIKNIDNYKEIVKKCNLKISQCNYIDFQELKIDIFENQLEDYLETEHRELRKKNYSIINETQYNLKTSGLSRFINSLSLIDELCRFEFIDLREIAREIEFPKNKIKQNSHVREFANDIYDWAELRESLYILELIILNFKKSK